MNSEPLLDIAYVTVRFARRQGWRRTALTAVDGVRLAQQPGETLGLVGESGSGKTTLSRVVAGLLPPSEGQVRLQGQDLWTLRRRDPKGLWRTVQYVFQDPMASLNPRRRVRDTLTAPLYALLKQRGAAARDRAAELLDLVGLEPVFLERYPHELSGGQAQRVALARALAPQPELLILDEPVSALDVSIQAQILTLLEDLKWELGLSYLFVSHDLAVVERLCDTVAVMRRGRIVEHGSVRTVFQSPRHPYTRRLLDSVPVPGQRTLVDPPAPSSQAGYA